MKNCKHCGAQLADDDDFCYFCGKPIEEELEPKLSNEAAAYQQQDNNSIAVVGFVLAFLFPLLGFIFSIIGLNKAKRLDGKNKGYAVAGILIAVANWVITFAIYFALYAYSFENGGA